MSIYDMKRTGILAKTTRVDENTVRISLDDLIFAKESWQEDGVITYQDYPKEKFLDMDFTEKELADFGHFVISRLLAGYKISSTN